jgi:hypothetical protein
LPGAAKEQFALLDGADGRRALLTIASPSGSKTVSIERSDRYLDQAFAGTGLNQTSFRWATFLPEQLIALMAIGTSLLLFLRRPRDPVSALIAMSTATSWATFALYELSPGTWVLFVDALANVMVFCGIVLFPDFRLASRWVTASIAAVLFYAAIGLVDLWIPVGPLINLSILAMCALALIALVQRFRATQPGGEQRQQMKFAMLGMATFMATQLIAALISMTIAGEPRQGAIIWTLLARSMINQFSIAALFIGLLVPLLRYRLYDADAVISRSAGYAFLSLLLAAAFAASEKLIEILGEQVMGKDMGAASAGLAAAFAAAMVAPLHNRIHHWAEHRFQHGVTKLRAGLPRLVGDMREYAPATALCESIAARLTTGVRARHVATLIEGEATLPFHAHNVAPEAVAAWRAGWTPPQDDAACQWDRQDPLFPARLRLHADGAGTIGWLLLGPRPDGSFYGKDEREALLAIAEPVARALHIARRREAANVAVESRFAALEAEIARLLGGVARPA